MFGAKLPIRRIQALACDGAFLIAMTELYARLDAGIAARRPVCVNRGECCRFDTFGHKLFVTPAELAFFLAGTDQGPLDLPPEPGGCCPYQRSQRCTARSARPAGCRVFFCEAASRDWQPAETEATLREISGVHARFDLPYAYVEWLDALRQLSSSLLMEAD